MRERGSEGVQSTGVSQRVRATGTVPYWAYSEKLFRTRDLVLGFGDRGSWGLCDLLFQESTRGQSHSLRVHVTSANDLQQGSA